MDSHTFWFSNSYFLQAKQADGYAANWNITNYVSGFFLLVFVLLFSLLYIWAERKRKRHELQCFQWSAKQKTRGHKEHRRKQNTAFDWPSQVQICAWSPLISVSYGSSASWRRSGERVQHKWCVYMCDCTASVLHIQVVCVCVSIIFSEWFHLISVNYVSSIS